MLDGTVGRTITGRPIIEAKKLFDDMQENYDEWHVERYTTKKLNSIIEEKNEELPTKKDELNSVIKCKEEVPKNVLSMLMLMMSISLLIISIILIGRVRTMLVNFLGYHILATKEHRTTTMERAMVIDITWGKPHFPPDFSCSKQNNCQYLNVPWYFAQSNDRENGWANHWCACSWRACHM